MCNCTVLCRLSWGIICTNCWWKPNQKKEACYDCCLGGTNLEGQVRFGQSPQGALIFQLSLNPNSNVNPPFALGNEFSLACVMCMCNLHLNKCSQLQGRIEQFNTRLRKKMKKNEWKHRMWEIKGTCIPEAKREFLRFSLTQHFRSNHHFDESYFLPELLFVVKCFAVWFLMKNVWCCRLVRAFYVRPKFTVKD